MANIELTSIGAQAAAVVLGTFLSGAMMGLSLMTVPLLLDTNVQTDHLLRQWLCLYNNGHRLLPALSVTTLLVYIYVAYDNWTNGDFWLSYGAAGTLTVGIIPFTLIVMLSTNNLLFQVEEDIKTNPKAITMESARNIIIKWSRMHLIRSIFPLAGAVLGFATLLREISAR